MKPKEKTFKCSICGADTGLTLADIEDCDPVCSEECSNKYKEIGHPLPFEEFITELNTKP